MTPAGILPEVLRRVRALTSVRPGATVLIDGRSGSGKTVLAQALAARTGAALLRLDDLYPGWHGLQAGSEQVVHDVLVPRATGRAGRWRAWDWHRDRPGVVHPVPHGPLIIEGVGALTARGRRLAHLGVWLELGEDERRSRAFTRDGAAYEPWWEIWAEQESAFIRREHPERLADLVIDG